jgi:hypothetical protein
MCKTPVTLGGGITTVYGSLPSGLLAKYFLSSQCWYQFASAKTCSKFLLRAISMLIKVAKVNNQVEAGG